MKEAAGELNATIFIVIVISLLMAFFYYVLWPIIDEGFDRNSQCSKAICETDPDKVDSDGYVECYSRQDKNRTFKCVYKG